MHHKKYTYRNRELIEDVAMVFNISDYVAQQLFDHYYSIFKKTPGLHELVSWIENGNFTVTKNK